MKCDDLVEGLRETDEHNVFHVTHNGAAQHTFTLAIRGSMFQVVTLTKKPILEWLLKHDQGCGIAVFVWGSWFRALSFDTEKCVLHLGNKIF